MDREQAKGTIMIILSRHVGREKAIGMGELYERVFGESYDHRINDTRPLRKLITDLRYDGALIGESRGQTGGGYYLARSTHELGEWFRKREREWLRKAHMLSRMKKLSLNEYLGQKILGLTERKEADGNGAAEEG